MKRAVCEAWGADVEDPGGSSWLRCYGELCDALEAVGLVALYALYEAATRTQTRPSSGWVPARALDTMPFLRCYWDGGDADLRRRFDAAERWPEYAALLAEGPGSTRLADELALRRLAGYRPAYWATPSGASNFGRKSPR